MPTEADFRDQLAREFESATVAGRHYVDIRSGYLHEKVGGYPAQNHRMPVCCSVMHAAMYSGDKILQSPPSGQGATLVIRYKIPR